MPAFKRTQSDDPKKGVSWFQLALIILCVIMLQRVMTGNKDLYTDFGYALSTVVDDSTSASSSESQSQSQLRSQSQSQSHGPSHDLLNPLSIPSGGAQNLPSVQIVDEQLLEERTIYGGKGDKSHLGGFTEIDLEGVSPAVWKHAVTNWTVQSVMDVGCGKGTSTSWFVTHGLRTECVEGSHDAIEQSMVPDKSILTEHDFSRGPWWPEKTFDMVWSVEFLEHVNLHFHYNYITTFRKAAILMVTSSKWGGWHHVEVHDDDWWIRKYESYGFRYDEKLSQEIRTIAKQEKNRKEIFPPNGKTYNPQHVWMSMKVFINPTVAALPEHAHLFGEIGCFTNMGEPNRRCGIPRSPRQAETAKQETPLDPSYYPLELTAQQDQAWFDIVKANIKQPE